MQLASELIFLIAGSFVGTAIAWLIAAIQMKAVRSELTAGSQIEITELRERLRSHEASLSGSESRGQQLEMRKNELEQEVRKLSEQRAAAETTIEKERQAADEKLSLLNEAQAKLSDAFKALSSDALRSNNQSFLELANSTLEKFQNAAKSDLESRQQAIESLVKPVQETLGKLEQNIGEIEIKREGAYQTFNQQVEDLKKGQQLLRAEASNLVRALGTPRVRGRWGEIQLKRVVEIAGMVSYCDFSEQQQVTTEEGRCRPDMLVRLPNGKNVIVDAKAPLSAYLDASSFMI